MSTIRIASTVLAATVAIACSVGCGDGTDVSLAKVPPVAPETQQPAKPFPKRATHSPAVLPGSEQK